MVLVTYCLRFLEIFQNARTYFQTQRSKTHDYQKWLYLLLLLPKFFNISASVWMMALIKWHHIETACHFICTKSLWKGKITKVLFYIICNGFKRTTINNTYLKIAQWCFVMHSHFELYLEIDYYLEPSKSISSRIRIAVWREPKFGLLHLRLGVRYNGYHQSFTRRKLKINPLGKN